MQRYAIINKPLGQTPLEAVEMFREAQKIGKDVPLSYAGRLDPMASGKLLLLIGDECKKQKRYTGLDKEYEVEVLLGVGSDTGDVLGIPTIGPTVSPSRDRIQGALKDEVGIHERAYPAFSSKTVAGKPLFLYALEGTLDSIEIPTHEEIFYRIDLIDVGALSSQELTSRVESILSHTPTSDEPSKALGADFRINTIRPAWQELLKANTTYPFLKIRVICGSGAYMRTLAGSIGKSLGTKGLALSIKRTRIGRYRTFPFHFWTRSY
ncbi:MAG TPA: hypothetical protein VEA92_01370 [Candidatus Paceibacterota bacterium]|nr:hypothetical protein [Candidatus Paceibacterota bacterium]